MIKIKKLNLSKVISLKNDEILNVYILLFEKISSFLLKLILIIKQMFYAFDSYRNYGSRSTNKIFIL